MHIVETGGWTGPLCRHCLAHAEGGGQPPWWPNERQRWQLRIERLFLRQLQRVQPMTRAVCAIIASFVARPWAP